ncbi:hypothetical protein QBC34DRAFT_390395 [Podospora aff. communis PSN243]|uniref:F-box domain-containing protein n=1 Tax=Podospora aff. communis PSN243 TaxID=3040156 RepID=A0AAV9H579_9PEZI|nr:hypothetical protein QBC34DRAFT_390395 [Podospora aff. communis PSN243]
MSVSGRELRPRRTTESQSSPAGVTPPRAGRVTRSSAATNASGGVSATPERRSSRQSEPARPYTQTSQLHTPIRRRGGKRTRHQSGFYDEDSDEDELLSSPVSPFVGPPSSSRGTRHSARLSRPANAPSPAKRRAIATPGKTATARRATPRRGDKPHRPIPRKPLPPPSAKLIDPGIIPEWQTLPYLIWVQIFKHASSPLDDREQVDWLLATSRICRAFAEPAMTALYHCPPLLTRPMAHHLVEHLSRDPSTTSFNYRAKVEKLRIDVQEIAAKTYRGQSLDFRRLVTSLPRLKVIDFSHEKDLPPFRSLDDPLRWHYPDSLFDALNGIPLAGEDAVPPTKLIGWRWNRRMMGNDTSPTRIKTLHMTPAFSNLKKLSFVNYQVPSLRTAGRAVSPTAVALDQTYVQELAEAISALPNLEYLSAESSTVVNDEFLALLPKTIRFLELVNCWEIGGEDFAAYLLSHGSRLEHLSLRHNQSLNLAFLEVLESACPRLQTLRVDLKNYNHHEFYNDSDPNYSEVLTVQQVPKWPASLETIELRNMKKWSAEAAEMLFQSLVDSAPGLANLRHLDLKTMLDIPFRQRSALRDKWEAKLKHVFLREKQDPKPFFSLRRPPVNNNGEAAGTIKKSPKKKVKVGTESENEARRSSRIATVKAYSPSSRASSVGRDLRGTSVRPLYAEVDTDADEDDDEEEAPGETKKSDAEERKGTNGAEEDVFRHGMCDVVEIQLDNQKIAEITWQMEDFLDEEPSDNPSDEDWDGDREADVEYAW